MSIPIHCGKCHAVIGIEDAMAGMDPLANFTVTPPTCEHKVTKTKKKRCFGLTEYVSQRYEDTKTGDSWISYVGPKHKFWIWFANVWHWHCKVYNT